MNALYHDNDMHADIQWNPVNTVTNRPKTFGRDERGGRITGAG